MAGSVVDEPVDDELDDVGTSPLPWISNAAISSAHIPKANTSVACVGSE